MKKITESTKVTLTLGQLKRLVKETRRAADSDFEIKNGVLDKYHGQGGHVVIPYGATRIDNFAFCDCSSLRSVTIPDSVTSIGDWAFGHCSSLRSVTIPDSVTSIGRCAFQWCSSLKDINASQKIRDAVLKTMHPSDGEDKQEEDDSDDTEDDSDDTNVITDMDFGEVVDELEYQLLDNEGCADLKDDSGIEKFREKVVYPAVNAFFNAGKTVEDKDEIMDFVKGHPNPYKFYRDKDPYEDG